jgi:hypothetical protein
MASILFRLTALAATGFVITILAMVAMLLGDPLSPANVWFNRHGATLLMLEVVAIVILGFAAMGVDRRESLRSRPTSDPAETDVEKGESPTDAPTD